MTDPFFKDLKRKICSGAALSIPYIAMSDTREEILKQYRETGCDLAFVDLQHAPYTDVQLMDFCRWSLAQGVPVQIRIRSPYETHLIGRYCDFGAASILVPMVEDTAVVRAAVEAFYYPGRGKRSWGPSPVCRAERFEGFEYANWWNEHGALGIQLETVTGIRNCADLVIEGVDMVTFGGADLTISLANTPDAPWTEVAEAIEYVGQALAQRDVRVGRIDAPFGDFDSIRTEKQE